MHRKASPLVSIAILLASSGLFVTPGNAANPGIVEIRAARVPLFSGRGDDNSDAGPAASSGRVWKVGPKEEFTKPSDVSKMVRSGDTVTIAPGTYADCAIWPRRINGLTILGTGAIIGDQSCARKGIFVVDSNNVVIRGITFRHAKVPQHNGAGIRAEGVNLTVENSRFIDNENGILANPKPASTIIIRNSYFQGNGNCVAQCAHGIYVNRVGLLHIEGSEFVGQHEGHHVKSRALKTELVNNTIHDGPMGDSSYLVDIPNAGTAIITGNIFEKGPRAQNRSAAIVIGEETQKRGGNPTMEIRIENNSFKNDLGRETIFVRNLSETPASLRANKIEGPVKPLVEDRNAR